MAQGVKIIATNRRAYYDYAVDEKYECGLELVGTEVKSVKDGRISFPNSWAEIVKGEVFLNAFRIAENPFSSIFNHNPERKKKLLLHKAEIKRLARRVEQKGFTLVPLSFYLKNGRVKVELGVCKGKKDFDKRESIKAKDLKRELARDMRL
jgi:SsrA-binding protein